MVLLSITVQYECANIDKCIFSVWYLRIVACLLVICLWFYFGYSLFMSEWYDPYEKTPSLHCGWTPTIQKRGN